MADASGGSGDAPDVRPRIMAIAETVTTAATTTAPIAKSLGGTPSTGTTPGSPSSAAPDVA